MVSVVESVVSKYLTVICKLEYLVHNLKIGTSHNSVATFIKLSRSLANAVLRESSSEDVGVLFL